MKLLKTERELFAVAAEEYFWMLNSTLDHVESNTYGPKGPTEAGAFFNFFDTIELNNRYVLNDLLNDLS